MSITYILYSQLCDCYYVGSTTMQMQDRLRRHRSNHNGFTGKASDWVVLYSEAYEHRYDAIKKEKKIKGRGARRFLEDIQKKEK